MSFIYHITAIALVGIICGTGLSAYHVIKNKADFNDLMRNDYANIVMFCAMVALFLDKFFMFLGVIPNWK